MRLDVIRVGAIAEGCALGEREGGEAERRQRTLLLVEDDRDVLDLMDRALGEAGRTIKRAANARDAMLEFLGAAGGIDLVVTDVVLPDTPGPEMVRCMLETRPDLRVLFISGYSPEIVQGYVRALPYPLLRKPFSITQLRSMVAQLLEE